LQEDKMLAVLPKEHPLSTQTIVSLKDLMKEPFILLDEIGLSEPLTVFQQNKLEPNVQFRVYDDFAIMSMIEKKQSLHQLLVQLVWHTRIKRYC
jgi:DNA-binding transcriptional LysR family regulator